MGDVCVQQYRAPHNITGFAPDQTICTSTLFYVWSYYVHWVGYQHLTRIRLIGMEKYLTCSLPVHWSSLSSFRQSCLSLPHCSMVWCLKGCYAGQGGSIDFNECHISYSVSPNMFGILCHGLIAVVRGRLATSFWILHDIYHKGVKLDFIVPAWLPGGVII